MLFVFLFTNLQINQQHDKPDQIIENKMAFQSKAWCPLARVNKFEHVQGSEVWEDPIWLWAGLIPGVLSVNRFEQVCSSQMGSSPPRKQTDRHTPVADPGFPRGGGANSPGGRQHTILPKFPKNCMKLKEFGPPGGHASKILLCRSATAHNWKHYNVQSDSSINVHFDVQP